MKNLLSTMGAVLLLTLTAAPVHAESANESAPLIQVFLGVMEPDDQTGQWDAVSEGPVDIDFSSLPSGGVEAEYLFGKDWVHWGLNPGGSIAWKNDDTKFSGSLTNANGGTLRFEADNSLFLAELHLGAYVRGRLSERVTTYAAAGPMVMYGSHDIKNENFEQVPSQGAPSSTADIDETDSSDINVGYYARAGIDFAINDKQQMGLGVRYLSTELDFDKTVGKLDIKGPQYVLTFTTQL